MDIIIVGAGIAGLSAGVGLRRAGHRVTILEQSSLLHEVGAAISIKPNAARVLASWDFIPERSGMVVLNRLSQIDGTSMRTLKSTSLKDLPTRTMHRVDLHAQLRRLATQTEGSGPPCDIQVRTRVVDYDAANARVTTTDGRVLQADLIVAADGVHSTAVQHVLGDEAVRAGDTGWACMRWLVPSDEILADPETVHLVDNSAMRYFTGAGGTVGLVWYPCRNGEVQNFVYLSREFDTSHVGEDFRAMVAPDMPLEYAKKHRFATELQTVIRKARDVKFWKLVARGPIPKWHKDRLLLVGDAAHPMLTFQGQAGGQAIEDGAALGLLFDQLRDRDPGTIEDRLRLFEQVRWNRTSVLQILTSTNPPLPQSVYDAAAAYLPGGTRVHTRDNVDDFVFSYDVIRESKAALGVLES